MLCIAHAFIWLPVSFVPPHHKQLIELNRMPFITHATKIWIVFDASPSQMFCTFFDGFHTPQFAIIASHTVSRRVSDRSVALAASCSSAWPSWSGYQPYRENHTRLISTEITEPTPQRYRPSQRRDRPSQQRDRPIHEGFFLQANRRTCKKIIAEQSKIVNVLDGIIS